MTYRIRYTEPGTNQHQEAQVEAHSPTEAKLKFRFTRDQALRGTEHVVTSVTPEVVPLFS
jgi:hypothetical protein